MLCAEQFTNARKIHIHQCIMRGLIPPPPKRHVKVFSIHALLFMALNGTGMCRVIVSTLRSCAIVLQRAACGLVYVCR